MSLPSGLKKGRNWVRRRFSWSCCIFVTEKCILGHCGCVFRAQSFWVSTCSYSDNVLMVNFWLVLLFLSADLQRLYDSISKVRSEWMNDYCWFVAVYHSVIKDVISGFEDSFGFFFFSFWLIVKTLISRGLELLVWFSFVTTNYRHTITYKLSFLLLLPGIL